MKVKVRREPVRVEVAKTNVGMSFVSKSNFMRKVSVKANKG